MDKGRLLISALELLPEKTISRGMRAVVSVPSKMAVGRFARHFGIDVAEAEKPLSEYGSILDLFTRRLKPGARPIDPDPRALVSPVDGAFLSGGVIGDGRLVQAKGRTFTLSSLLAEDGIGARFARGYYAILYLSPKDYHRIHSPVRGRIVGSTYVPGALWPVNRAGVAHVDELFAKNERLVTQIESERFGRVYVVMVGATCVGHMKVSYDREVCTNVGGREIDRKRYDLAIPIDRGDELGVFEMGSTVIVLTEEPVEAQAFPENGPIRMGSRLGLGPSR